MATLTARPELVTDLGRFLVRERDRALRISQEHADLPQIAAAHKGKADAFDLALSYLAGHVGLRTTTGLVALLAGDQPAASDVDPSWSEAELRLAWGDR